MLRILTIPLLIPFLCAVLIACSSDDSSALNKWFDDQGIATSYGGEFEEVEISVKSFALGADSSAYMVSSFAALGNVNEIENSLYFGLEVLDTMPSVWKLRADSVFYADIYGGKVPEKAQKKLEARIYWQKEDSTAHDTTWLKFEKTAFKDSADISIDTFLVQLPEELLKLKSSDTLRLLVYIKLLSNGTVLRITPPNVYDIPGLLRVAQKTKVLYRNHRLHAGTRESLYVAFEIGNKIKAGRTVVFAELVFPKESGNEGNELDTFALPVYVYSKLGLEDYRVDTVSVKASEKYGHPNLVFSDGDSLKLQVTKGMRHYAAAKPLPDTVGFTFKLGSPMLKPKSLYFYNSVYSSEKVFSDRPAYSSYDFSALEDGNKVKLRLWYAKTDID